jgi:hypothetical protein
MPFLLQPSPLQNVGKFIFQEVSVFGHYAVPNIFPADLDKDGDVDLILAFEENNSIIQVYENLGGAVFRNPNQ